MLFIGSAPGIRCVSATRFLFLLTMGLTYDAWQCKGSAAAVGVCVAPVQGGVELLAKVDGGGVRQN